MAEPPVSIRCWAERLESGRFQGRATVTVRAHDGITRNDVTCTSIRESKADALDDVDTEVLRRFLATTGHR